MAPSSPSSSGQEANAEIVLNAAIVEGTASNSVKLGTLKGVPILVHWSVIFLLAFNCLTSLIYTNPLEVLLFDSIFWGPMVILSLFVVSVRIIKHICILLFVASLRRTCCFVEPYFLTVSIHCIFVSTNFMESMN